MPEQTKEILASMLRENTGRHMLDSGGAYGRHWERNQKRSFEDEPEVFASFSESGLEASINLYHWLEDRLIYDPEMDRIFRLWAAASSRKEESWFSLVESFTEAVKAKVQAAGKLGRWGNYYPSDWQGATINTYNGEDALSQTIQYTLFQARGEHYCLLSIHNGCDVRGGYTEPRVFTFREEPTDLMSNASLTLSCAGVQRDDPSQLTLDGSPLPPPAHHYWDSDNGGYSWRDENSHEVDFTFEPIPDGISPADLPALLRAERSYRTTDLVISYDDSENGYCPLCGAPLTVSPGY